ncbi:MAG TPA: hypothetical protein VJ904_00875, partial [Tichowtungia sp.]|nr:hypothetical protein [Tichowtungia sp.]
RGLKTALCVYVWGWSCRGAGEKNKGLHGRISIFEGPAGIGPDAELAEAVKNQTDGQDTGEIRRESVRNKVEKVKSQQVGQMVMGPDRSRSAGKTYTLRNHYGNTIDGQGNVGQDGRRRAAEKDLDLLRKRGKQIEIPNCKGTAAEQKKLQQLEQPFPGQYDERLIFFPPTAIRIPETVLIHCGLHSFDKFRTRVKLEDCFCLL